MFEEAEASFRSQIKVLEEDVVRQQVGQFMLCRFIGSWFSCHTSALWKSQRRDIVVSKNWCWAQYMLWVWEPLDSTLGHNHIFPDLTPLAGYLFSGKRQVNIYSVWQHLPDDETGKSHTTAGLITPRCFLKFIAFTILLYTGDVEFLTMICSIYPTFEPYTYYTHHAYLFFQVNLYYILNQVSPNLWHWRAHPANYAIAHQTYISFPQNRNQILLSSSRRKATFSCVQSVITY